MKRCLFTCTFLLLSLPLFSQKNVLKARAIGLPGRFRAFSTGLGYERMLGESWSVQGLLNHQGWDMTDTDGGGEIANALLVEGRYYFGRYKKESLNKASFFGAFIEQSWAKLLPGDDGKYTFSHGILIGRNTPISKRLLVEWFVGGKYRSGHTVYRFRTVNNGFVTNREYFHNLGLRLGFNFCVRL
jgi:hypothetical protein